VALDAATPDPAQLVVDQIGEMRRGLLVVCRQNSHRQSDAGRSAIDSYDALVAGRPDETLLAEARAGDLEAFAELVLRYERRVRSVLARFLDDERDVEEAAQDAFVQAWRSLSRYRGEAAFFTWLYRIAVNEARMRRRRRQLPLTELDENAATAPEPEVEEGWLLARVRALPDELRVPLVLRDLEGLSNQEVADVLDLSVAAAKSRIHRARMQIRAELEAREASE
jgi:RNA polymerase sigma-70 factor (ECF subfamily)